MKGKESWNYSVWAEIRTTVLNLLEQVDEDGMRVWVDTLTAWWAKVRNRKKNVKALKGIYKAIFVIF